MSSEIARSLRKYTLCGAIFMAAAVPRPSEAAFCSVTAAAMNFGVYDPLSTIADDSTTTVTLRCIISSLFGSEVVAYVVTASAGTGSFADRWLTSGANRLSYNLYVSPAMSPATVWGDGSGGTQRFTGSLPAISLANPLATANLTVYGRIAARQDVPIGVYSASVIITMDF
ncbi:MAG: spore coat U domain-containing protein [Burkholderiales bacterium]|jgi:spore coat protein U-like protein